MAMGAGILCGGGAVTALVAETASPKGRSVTEAGAQIESPIQTRDFLMVMRGVGGLVARCGIGPLFP